MERRSFRPDVEDSGSRRNSSTAARDGFFVDVGANDPKNGSQTWHLEQSRLARCPRRTAAALAQRLKNSARAAGLCLCLLLAAECRQDACRFRRLASHSSLNPDFFVAGMRKEEMIEVPVRTLDDILEEANAPSRSTFFRSTSKATRSMC